MRPRARTTERAATTPRAFTLIEMLVVITIISILLLVTIPSFNAMMYSSEQSLGENLLRAAMRAGRDAAVRSGADRDAAVVFMYQPETQRTQMVVCIKAGTLRDADPADAQGVVPRDVFVAARDMQPQTLPRGWMVRAFVPAGFITPAANTDAWYSHAAYDNNVGNWVFPENGFYDVSAVDGGWDRHTFMVRFEGGTGLMRSGLFEPGLVLSPSPSSTVRDNLIPPNLQASYGLAELESEEEYVRRILAAPPNVISAAIKQRLIGRESPDIVLAKPVSQLAIYDEARLAAAIGGRIDNISGCMYRRRADLTSTTDTNATTRPQLLSGVQQSRINDWIQGDTNGDGQVSGAADAGEANSDQPEARLFTIDRYTGILHQVEVQP